jgi:cytoskeletal protein CcmA (bactofilin family)
MVDGEVISERSVTVGQSAQVKGPVKGQLVTVAGVIRGSVEATEKFEVLETGKIFGSINARDLVVHSGAIIIGDIKMDNEEVANELPEPPQAPVEEKSAEPDETEEKKEPKFDLKPDDE